MLEPYFYDVPKQREVRPPRRVAKFAKEPEELTGKVQNATATAGEERLARELDGHSGVLNFWFRIAVGAPRGVPGWKEIDFLIRTLYGYVAAEVDEMEFIHRGASSETVMEDAIRIKGLADQGIKVHEIKHIPAARLETQEGAAQVANELVTT